MAVAASMALTVPAEGLRFYAYRDPAAIPTICSGHTKGVYMGQHATPEECQRFLEEDTKEAMDAVLRYTVVPLNENELGAYTDFTLNLGSEKFRTSTLLRYLNAGNRDAACKQLLRWVYAGGQKYQGLVNRRNKEYALCMKPSEIQ
ncbi:MAG: Lysozyme RrrD [Herbaspirillum frisingense]|uniref:Lysozyme n=1 Tax=Herbaspirillum frisingense TaxID=92645 RepID=A0A7V8JUE6_9BURK|nr:MAG: Lysozyme RrrD [Herbaspirillum frisingense]